MPTTSHEEDEVDGIYDIKEERLEGIKGNECVIVMGDWNGSVEEGGQENCVGQYGLGKRNERGDKLIEFCNEQDLLITNTWFQQEKGEYTLGRHREMVQDTNWIISWFDKHIDTA